MAVVLLENQFYSIGPRSHPSICFAAAAAREGRNQCDHMASLFVHFWSFATVKICQKQQKIA